MQVTWQLPISSAPSFPVFLPYKLISSNVLCFLSLYLSVNKSVLSIYYVLSIITLCKIFTCGLLDVPLLFLLPSLFLNPLFFEEGMEREREGGKHRCDRETSTSCLSYVPPAGNPTHNPGMCPDWEMNLVTFFFMAGCPTN